MKLGKSILGSVIEEPAVNLMDDWLSAPMMIQNFSQPGEKVSSI
jgi:hypothetical protein